MSISELTPAQKLLALRLAVLANERYPEATFTAKGITIKDEAFPVRASDLVALYRSQLTGPISYPNGDDEGRVYVRLDIENCRSKSFNLSRERLVLEIAYALSDGEPFVDVSESKIAELLKVKPNRVSTATGILAGKGLITDNLDGDNFSLLPAGIAEVEDPPIAAAGVSTRTVNIWGSGQYAETNHGTMNQGADAAAVLEQVRQLIAEMADVFKAALPPDDARDATRDADSIVEELTKEHPDPETVAKKSRSILTRLTDSIRVGGKVGEVALAINKMGSALQLAAQYFF